MLALDGLGTAAQSEFGLLCETLRGQGPEVVFRTAAGRVLLEACHGNQVPSMIPARGRLLSGHRLNEAAGSVAAMIALTACWLKPL